MRRIELLDAFRGISIILVAAYHFGYDLVVFEFIPPEVLYNTLLNTLEIIFAGGFILLAGISSKLSKNNFKRGLYVLVCAALVSLAGLIVRAPIWFGILHLLACCILLYAVLEKMRITFYFVLSAAFLASFFKIDVWPDIVSYDNFPLIPWGFLFFLGVLIGNPIREGRFPQWFYSVKIPFLPFIGRHTMLIYMAHQPILYLLTWTIKAVS